MESLVLLVVLLAGAVLLSGPLAVLADYFRRPLLASLLATTAIWLGIFWFAHTYTSIKYVGLFSTALGLYVVWRTAQR